MKMIKTLIIAIVLCLASINFVGCGDEASEEVKALAAMINKECPENLGDGMVIESATTQGKDLVIVFKIEEEIDSETEMGLKLMAPMLSPIMAEAFKQESGSEGIVFSAVLKKNNANMIIRFKGKNKAIDLVLEAKDL
ncbi:MAG: hypothetical protein MJY87_11990 [Fibrobacter sp.]|nr:hypothetical protein [Fibrobacter sp.]